MDSGGEYSTSARLIQIEGPDFVDLVRKIFKEYGIAENEVETVVAWAIGEDFSRIRLQDWPPRLQKKGLDVKGTDLVIDGIKKIAKAWKEKDDEATSRSPELRSSEDRNDDESNTQSVLP